MASQPWDEDAITSSAVERPWEEGEAETVSYHCMRDRSSASLYVCVLLILCSLFVGHPR